MASEEIGIPNYHILRLDRDRHGGGVLMYVNSNFSAKIVMFGPNDLELIIISASCTYLSYCKTKKEKILFQQAKRTGNRSDHDKYKRFRNRFTNMLRQSKQRYRRGLRFPNKKHFWKAIKKLNQQKTLIPTLVEDNKIASSKFEKAEMLNKFFSIVLYLLRVLLTVMTWVLLTCYR